MTEFPTYEEMDNMSEAELRAMSLNLTMQVIDSDEHNRFIDHLGGIEELRKSAADFIARILIMTLAHHNHLESHINEIECDAFEKVEGATHEILNEGVMVGMLLDPANFTTKLHDGFDVLGKMKF